MNTIAETASPPRDTTDQWPERPRLVSLRGLLWSIVLFAFCICMSVLILRSRQLISIQATELWGEQGTELIRRGRPVELKRPAGATASEELDRYHTGWLDLTELRDIGYFRRIFLDDKSFDWSKTQTVVGPGDGQDTWMQIRFGADPANTSDSSLTILFNRNEGWVYPQTGNTMVQLREQAFRRIKYRLELIAKLKEK